MVLDRLEEVIVETCKLAKTNGVKDEFTGIYILVATNKSLNDFLKRVEGRESSFLRRLPFRIQAALMVLLGKLPLSVDPKLWDQADFNLYAPTSSSDLYEIGLRRSPIHDGSLVLNPDGEAIAASVYCWFPKPTVESRFQNGRLRGQRCASALAASRYKGILYVAEIGSANGENSIYGNIYQNGEIIFHYE